MAKTKAKKVLKKVLKKTVKKAVKKTKVSPRPVTKLATKTKVKSDLSDMFVPLDDRVLIERTLGPKKTPGGLFVPDSAQEQTDKGTVLSVGPGHKSPKGNLRPTAVKTGEQILFAKYAGTEIKIGDKNYIILRETDIIGVID